MVRFAIRLLSGVLLITVPFLFSAISAPPAGAAATLQTITVYGGNGTVGTIDSATEVSRDGGATWGAAYFAGTHPWGLVAGTSTWINCGPTLNDCLNAVSWYRYRFYLASDFETTTLTAAIKVDNLASMYINGAHLQYGGGNLNVVGGSGGTWSGSPPDWSTTDLSIQSYLHAGWNDISVELTDQGGLAGINYAFTIKTYSTSPITLSSPGQTFTLTYDAQGGSTSRTLDTSTAGGSISSFPTPTRSGYSFDGWFTQSSGGTQVTAPISPSSNQTIYAHWTSVAPPVIYSTLSFNAQGGTTNTSSYTVVQGTQLSTLPRPVRTGYTFLGWFDNQLAGSEFTVPRVISSNLTLYAHWQRIIDRVTWNSGESATTSIQLIEEGDSITAPVVPVRGGYSFLGWLETVSATSIATFPQVINSDTVFYAQWSANTYVISFPSPSGTTTMPATQGSSFTAPVAPTPPFGYNFLYWSTNQDGSGERFTGGETIPRMDVTDNFSLYPQYEVQGKYQSGSLTSVIYFGMDEYFLDAEDKRLLLSLAKRAKSYQLPQTRTTVHIVGWVQPTSINPQIEWLSYQRALAVKRTLVRLGLKARYIIEAPGLAADNSPLSRRSTIEISWNTPQR